MFKARNILSSFIISCLLLFIPANEFQVFAESPPQGGFSVPGQESLPQGYQGEVSAPFVPSDISGLVAEFYADTGVTLEAGTNVSNWADQSGNGNDYTATFSARPTFHSSPDRIQFNGMGNRLRSATFTLNQSFTRVFLITPISWSANSFICDGFTNQTTYMYQNNLSPEIRLTAGSSEPEHPGITIGVEAVLIGIWDRASSQIIVDDGTPTVAGADIGAANPAGITLGNDAASNNGSAISVRAEVVYNKVLSPSEITQITDYFQTL